MPDANVTLAELAVTYPAATRVFTNLGLDFCCKGRRPLSDACREKNIDPAGVLDAITADADASTSTAWTTAPLTELIDFILHNYHAGLRREIPELIAMADKVESVHGDKASCPRGLAAHLRAAHAAVLDHLEKEEVILFPMIREGRGAVAPGPIFVMEREHSDHGESLARTRELTNGLVPPAEACTTWRALYLRLEQLERDLMEHIHLENNVLFPRALNG